jgi:hypothetical protein
MSVRMVFVGFTGERKPRVKTYRYDCKTGNEYKFANKFAFYTKIKIEENLSMGMLFSPLNAGFLIVGEKS